LNVRDSSEEVNKEFYSCGRNMTNLITEYDTGNHANGPIMYHDIPIQVRLFR